MKQKVDRIRQTVTQHVTSDAVQPSIPFRNSEDAMGEVGRWGVNLLCEFNEKRTEDSNSCELKHVR